MVSVPCFYPALVGMDVVCCDLALRAPSQWRLILHVVAAPFLWPVRPVLGVGVAAASTPSQSCRVHEILCLSLAVDKERLAANGTVSHVRDWAESGVADMIVYLR